MGLRWDGRFRLLYQYTLKKKENYFLQKNGNWARYEGGVGVGKKAIAKHGAEAVDGHVAGVGK